MTNVEMENLNTISDIFEYVNSQEDFYEFCNESTSLKEYLLILEIILLQIILWISKKKRIQNYDLSISLSEINLYRSILVSDVQWSQWSLHQKKQYDSIHMLYLRLLNDYVKKEVQQWYANKKMVVKDTIISNFKIIKEYFESVTEGNSHKQIVKLLLSKLSEYRLHIRICESFIVDILHDVRKLLMIYLE
jgi:hypothetical protein